MIPLGLSYAQQVELRRVLINAHNIEIGLSLLNLEQDFLSNITNTILDGSTNVSQSGEITRMGSLQLYDPDNSLPFDSDSPSDGALYLDRMLRVTYGVPVFDEWVRIPVQTGPITKLDRQGDVVNVEVSGKEKLCMTPMWRPLTIKKGTKKTDAIKRILRERYGEQDFDIPDLPFRLNKTMSLGRKAIGWKQAKKIAHSMDRQLFFNGRGTCTLRRFPQKPNYTWRGNQDVLGEVQVNYDDADVINAVFVNGGTPKGAKKPVTGWAVAPRSHPLSPYRLGRTVSGEKVPSYHVHEVDLPHVKSKKVANQRAHTILVNKLRQSINCTFESFCLPMLDAGDVGAIFTGNADIAEFSISEFSLPYVVGNNMSVGFMKRVTVKADEIRDRGR